MAVFDKTAERIVVEVCYDGPALAGKTTNLEQLCQFFTTLRRSELFTTQNTKERTLFLDWLALDGGLVAGQKLRCQLITVPGQTVLARRRWHLLGRADVIVFVIDSTPRGLEDGRGMFNAVKEFCDEGQRRIPLIVQANKQDRVGAVSRDEIARALGIDENDVIPARADSGLGVRETAVVAIRRAADLVQKKVLKDGLESLAGRAQNGEEIKQQILEAEQADPRRPVEIFMEHARRVYSTAADADDPHCDEPDESKLQSTVPPPRSSEPVADETCAPEISRSSLPSETAARPSRRPTHVPGPQNETRLATYVSPSTKPTWVPVGEYAKPGAPEPPTPHPSRLMPDGASQPPEDSAAGTPQPGSLPAEGPAAERGAPSIQPLSSLPPDATTPSSSSTVASAAAEPYRAVQPGPRRLSSPERTIADTLPPLPRPDPPSGFIWPSASGRDVLRRVPLVSARIRSDLAGQVGTRDGSGRSDTMIYEAGVWCLKTSPRRRYDSVDAARKALLHLVRRKLALGALLVENTVLMLQSDDAGGYWLWTVSPWLTTLRAAMCHADDQADQERLEKSLLSFASAALESLRLAVHREVQLDVHPSNFATRGPHTYYVDDDIGNGVRVPSIGHSLLRRVEEYADCPKIVDAYVEHLATGIQSFSAEESRQLDLKGAFTDTIVRTVAGQVARRRLLQAVS